MIYGACHQPTQPETSAYSEALGMYRLAKLFGRDMEWLVDREKLPVLGK